MNLRFSIYDSKGRPIAMAGLRIVEPRNATDCYEAAMRMAERVEESLMDLLPPDWQEKDHSASMNDLFAAVGAPQGDAVPEGVDDHPSEPTAHDGDDVP